ncbi:MAG: type II toxin-antitoxin system HicB family antitoxin [Candidatus Micrarchaeota archaeon]
MKQLKVAGREFTILIEKDEDGYFVGSVPEIRGCFSQARSIKALLPRMREVIELCLEEGSVEALPKKNPFLGIRRIQVKMPHAQPAPS